MKIEPPAMEHIKDSHCSYCGAKFTDQKNWPRKCFICWNESYKNPIPIVVSMMGVLVEHRMGILIQQRNINPEKGKWALPSGYINHGESWEEAAVRENQEEMQITSRPQDYHLFGIRKPASGNMLVFCNSNLFLPGDLSATSEEALKHIENFVLNDEVSAMGIWYGDTELAFPTHNECAQLYLARLKNTQSPWNY